MSIAFGEEMMLAELLLLPFFLSMQTEKKNEKKTKKKAEQGLVKRLEQEKKYLVIFGNGLGDFTPEFLRFKVTLLVTRYDETLKTRGPNFVCDFPQNFLNLGKKKNS